MSVWVRRTSTAAAFILVACVPLDATMIVVLGTAERIVVAADSRLSIQDEHGRVSSYRDDSCKLAVDRQLVLAVAGFEHEVASERISASGVREAWAAANRRPETLMDRVSSMVAELRLRNVRVPFITRTEFMVFGMIGALPGFQRVILTYVPTASRPRIEVSEVYGHLSAAFVGEVPAVTAEETRQRLLGMTTSDMVALAESIVREQMNATDKVGGPVDIVLLQQGGPAWVKVKSHCR